MAYKELEYLEYGTLLSPDACGFKQFILFIYLFLTERKKKSGSSSPGKQRNRVFSTRL
jgi:hypothetical protein